MTTIYEDSKTCVRKHEGEIFIINKDLDISIRITNNRLGMTVIQQDAVNWSPTNINGLPAIILTPIR